MQSNTHNGDEVRLTTGLRSIGAAAATMVLLPLSTGTASAGQPALRPSAAPEQTSYVPGPGSPVPEQPDAKFIEECEADPEAQSLKGRVYHRGVWCQTTEVELDTKQGKATLDITAAAYADPSSRRVRVFFRVNDWSTDSFGPVNGARTLRMRLVCDNQCGVTGNDDGDKAQALADWRVDEDLPVPQPGWVKWDVTSPDTGAGREHMLQHLWQFQGTLEGQPLLSDDHEFGLPEHRVRCDSAGRQAGYTNWTPQACINDNVIPFLTYRKSDERVAGVARHLDNAFNNPQGTHPKPGSPKSIPGKYTGDPDSPGLHRIASRAVNDREQRRIRLGQDIYGPQDLPPVPQEPLPPGATWQLDEFPFGSTQEGLAAARGNLDAGGPFNGSVAWVNSQQNGAAGIELREFYRKDRILLNDLDRFYVRILP